MPSSGHGSRWYADFGSSVRERPAVAYLIFDLQPEIGFNGMPNSPRHSTQEWMDQNAGDSQDMFAANGVANPNRAEFGSMMQAIGRLGRQCVLAGYFSVCCVCIL